MHINHIVLYFFISFVSFIIGCSGGGTSDSASNEFASVDLSVGEHAVFPHPDRWADSTYSGFHGYWLKANGFNVIDTTCVRCHDKESTISSANAGGGPPGCKSCHTVFPHVTGWRNGVDEGGHGKYVLSLREADASVTGTEECQQCHGDDLNGGITGVSCNQCHTVYPHGDATAWALKTNHGQAALENGFDVCQRCHGDDFEGGDTGIRCRSCHEGVFPHGVDVMPEGGIDVEVAEDGSNDYVLSDDDMITSAATGADYENIYDSEWREKINHGRTTIQLGYDVCRGCHGSDLTGGDVGVSCYQCHSFAPHVDGWAEPDVHGVTAKGNGKELCTGCHGEDLSGEDTGTACNKCHIIYPHTKGKNATAAIADMPTGTEWSDIENHGYYALNNGTTLCAGQCHGSDLEGGLSGVACTTACHAVPAPHDAATLPSWADSTYRKNAGEAIDTDHPFHGDYAEGAAKSTCMGCHGNDLTGGDAGVSCFQCHVYAPHQDSDGLPDHLKVLNDAVDSNGDGTFDRIWDTDGDADDVWVADATGSNGKDIVHAAIAVSLMRQGNISECTRCHGENFDREVGGIKCTNCHENGVTHTSASMTIEGTTYTGGWGPNIGGGSNHGTYFSTYFTANDSDAFCWDCHGSPIVFTDSSTTGTYFNACNNCHGVSGRSSDQTQASLAEQTFCYSCHLYPHLALETESLDSAGDPVINRPAW